MTPMRNSRTADDGSETWMQLKDKRLLRQAMNTTKVRADGGPDCTSIPKLALAAGLSNAAVGFLLSHGRSGRNTCTVGTAEAICTALGWDIDLLFVRHSRPTQSGPPSPGEAAA